MLHNASESIPDAWQYRPSPLGVESELESWPAEEVAELFAGHEVTADELRHIGNVLARYERVLVRAGRDY